MNMTCEIVRDLAELYHENIVSRESAGMIRTHLKTCESCRRYYREYDSAQDMNVAVQQPPLQGMNETQAKLYNELSRKLRRRHLLRIIGVSAAIGAGSIMLATGILLTCKSSSFREVK